MSALLRLAVGWLVFAFHVEAGMASTFSAVGDRWNPQPYAACLRRDLRDATDAIVASRTLPCLSRVWIYCPRTGRSTVAIVGDRGPRRMLVDLAPLVARRLRHNGLEQVLLLPLGGGR